jgi:hypothetical protein
MSARIASSCIYAVMVATFTGIAMSNTMQAQEQTFA